ncbi:hypothetical protein [Lentzea atacamensis]|uniref:hypothetical protein n=1 Tax=Lentzea atacamensis TaxID=531938 RepID=UPI0011BEF588|nr:hypothetical protein [Lentzea atacamensis]
MIELVVSRTPEIIPATSEKALIGDDLRVRVSYHAQCDNYDRIGTVFYVAVPKGATPTAARPRVTLQDFITPFRNYWRGVKANCTFPDADLGPYAGALADPGKDVHLGIGGGSNRVGQLPRELGAPVPRQHARGRV